MLKVKNIWHRPLILNGIEVKPGETKLVPKGGAVGYCLARGRIKIIHTNVRLYEKSELEKMKMSELRKIGAPLGAYDTKKSELIEEILEKQEVSLDG